MLKKKRNRFISITINLNVMLIIVQFVKTFSCVIEKNG